MRRNRVRVLVILLAIAMSAALGACDGAISGTSAPGTQSLTPGTCSTSTGGNTAAVRIGSGAVRAGVRAVPVMTLPPGVTVGQVRVVVESGEYRSSDTIFAWAGNGLGRCIYVMDHRSDCSIIVLERQVNGAWQPQANCQLATPTRTLILPPMQATFIRLMPPATGAQPGVWQSGTYRVAFSYRLDQTGTGQPVEVVSDTFTIT